MIILYVLWGCLVVDGAERHSILKEERKVILGLKEDVFTDAYSGTKSFRVYSEKYKYMFFPDSQDVRDFPKQYISLDLPFGVGTDAVIPLFTSLKEKAGLWADVWKMRSWYNTNGSSYPKIQNCDSLVHDVHDSLKYYCDSVDCQDPSSGIKELPHHASVGVSPTRTFYFVILEICNCYKELALELITWAKLYPRVAFIWIDTEPDTSRCTQKNPSHGKHDPESAQKLVLNNDYVVTLAQSQRYDTRVNAANNGDDELIWPTPHQDHVKLIRFPLGGGINYKKIDSKVVRSELVFSGFRLYDNRRGNLMIITRSHQFD